MINGDGNVIPPAVGKSGEQEPEPVKTRRRAKPADAVEITGRSAPHETRQIGPKLTESELSDTIAQVRIRLQGRIKSGFYDSEEVLQGIANKILDILGM